MGFVQQACKSNQYRVLKESNSSRVRNAINPGSCIWYLAPQDLRCDGGARKPNTLVKGEAENINFWVSLI